MGSFINFIKSGGSSSPMITGFIMIAATEAEIAITTPTERSTPPVAITSVMPIANSITVDALRIISIRLPYRLPSRVWTLKKPGMKIRSKSKIKDRVSKGKKSLLSVIFLHVILDFICFMIHLPWLA